MISCAFHWHRCYGPLHGRVHIGTASNHTQVKHLTFDMVGLWLVSGARYLELPCLKLFSSYPDFIIRQSLYSLRRKGSQRSVSQLSDFLGYGGLLPLHGRVLGVPVGMLFRVTLVRSVSFASTPIAAQYNWFCSWDVGVHFGRWLTLPAERCSIARGLLALNARSLL